VEVVLQVLAIVGVHPGHSGIVDAATALLSVALAAPEFAGALCDSQHRSLLHISVERACESLSPSEVDAALTRALRGLQDALSKAPREDSVAV
jgi:hypothetical protein